MFSLLKLQSQKNAERMACYTLAWLLVYSLHQATDNDYDFLYQLHVSSMREYIEATWGWEDEWQQEYFARKFDPRDRQIIEIERQNAGVIVVEHHAEEHYIALLEILPAFQRRGVGTSIVRQLIEVAHKDGLPISLHVLQTNIPARRFYERLGFTVMQDEAVRYKMTCPP